MFFISWKWSSRSVKETVTRFFLLLFLHQHRIYCREIKGQKTKFPYQEKTFNINRKNKSFCFCCFFKLNFLIINSNLRILFSINVFVSFCLFKFFFTFLKGCIFCQKIERGEKNKVCAEISNKIASKR